ncbi:TTF-type domain-containing protein [Trichonephila clavipes]|nr:TTF-type domain-containing protein [Trichonephila clavipes]
MPDFQNPIQPKERIQETNIRLREGGKDIPFEWTLETQASFENIKKAILNPPILALPEPAAALQITTDVSCKGIGAGLEQRAHRESLELNDSRHSGNFMDLFKLLSKYDLTLREHMQSINEKQLTQHYLSHDIQNELIALMSKSVIEEIIHRVKQAKYYAFLLDCTRDVSRVEQMSIILKFCNSSTGAIEEHFVGFIAFAETTGEYITNSILQELERNGLNIQNCRGQGYDNGANRVGINKKASEQEYSI